MKKEDFRIAIVGGGPGGLTLARLLQLQGRSIQVYERDEHPGVRVQGATLDLHEESGLEAIRRAQLMEGFTERYRPDAGKTIITDCKGKIFYDEHEETGHGANRPEIDRGPLRELLLGSLQPGTVIWNSRFSRMEKKNNGWELHFHNGHTAHADLVIAADGASSGIRPYITGIKQVYSGISILEGNIYAAAQQVPGLHAMVKGGKWFAFGHRQSIIVSAKGDGSLSFYTGSWMLEKDNNLDTADRKNVQEWFEQTFPEWSNPFAGLFTAEDSWFVQRPQYHFPVDQRWAPQHNITMIGDAAHRMPPYAGEGVNMAMQDAFELAECLEKHDTAAAIATFEKSMCTRAGEVTGITLEATRRLHGDDPISYMLSVFNGD